MRTVTFLTCALMLILTCGSVLAEATYQVQTFDEDPVLWNTGDTDSKEGKWYPDRYAPAVFEQVSYAGRDCLRLGLRDEDNQTNRSNTDGHYNYQGRKYNTPYNGYGTYVSVDLYVDDEWTTGSRAGIWATASNGNNSYPIIEFCVGGDIVAPYESTGEFTGFRYWQSGIGWTSFIEMQPDNKWYTLKIDLTNDNVMFNILNASGNTESTATVDNLAADSFDNIILQGHNQGVAGEYNIHYDNVTTAVPLPPSVAMLGLGLVGAGGFGWMRRRRR